MAKQLFLFISILVCATNTYAQKQLKSKRLDRIGSSFVKQYPNDSIRAVQIYQWIHRKLRYDFKSYRKFRFPSYNNNPIKVLKRGKALCSGFSVLYEDLCKRSKVLSVEVAGYTRSDQYPGGTLYYANHAWNIVKLNRTWRTCDITADNGYLAPRVNAPIYLIKRILKIPYICTKYKYVEKSTLKSWALDPKRMIQHQYPTLYNAQGLDTCIHIKEFENEQTSTQNSPQLSPLYYPQDLEDYYWQDFQNRALLEIKEVRKSNPNDHFTILQNYRNYLVEGCSEKDIAKRDLYCTGNVFIDSGLVHGRLFLRDNKAMNQYNRNYINKERSIFSMRIQKIKSHNNGLKGRSRRKYFGLKALVHRMKWTTDRGTLSYEKKYDRRYQIRHKGKATKKQNLLQQQAIYQKNLLIIDSMQTVFKQLCEQLGDKPEQFKLRADTLVALCQLRTDYIKSIFLWGDGLGLMRDIVPEALQPADSITQRALVCSKWIEHYEKVDFKNFHNRCIVLNGRIFACYMQNFKIKLLLNQSDSLMPAQEGMKNCIENSKMLYKKLLQHKEDLKDHNHDLHKVLEKEGKLLNHAIHIMKLSHKERMLSERHRLVNYNHAANFFIDNLKYWKKYKAQKKSPKIKNAHS